MIALRELIARVRGTLRPARTDCDLEQELRAHLELAADDAHTRERLSDRGADGPATSGFGVAQAMDALRDQRGFPWVVDLVRDVRLAARTIRKRPAFSVTAILTLAIGIAANGVVFAVVKTVLLTPLPYREPDRLVTVAESDSHTPNADRVSFATVRDLLDRTHTFEHLSLFGDYGVRPVLGNRVEQLRGMRVTTDFFETLGVPMYLGRSFRPEEGMSRAADVLILTHGAWVDLFASDPAVVGRSIPTIDSTYLVVGVLPPDFHPLPMTNPAELPRVFTPLRVNPALRECRECRGWRAIARLAPGVASGAAEAELTATMRSIVRDHPSDYAADASVRVRPLRDQVVGQFGAALWLLQAAVLLLLILACANVATLLVARTIPRQREMAVRTALGAGRGRLVRQMLTESLLLAGTAALVGVSLAWAATGFIARTSTTNIPRITELAPDWTILFFGIVAGATTSIVFGLLPAILDSRGSAATIRISQSATGHCRHYRIVHGLIACELALAFVLVLSVGLLGKSYARLMQVEPGFDPRNVLTLSLLPDGVHYPSQPSRVAYFESVVERVRMIPGVVRAGYASTLPLSHPFTARLHIRERPVTNATDAPSLDRYLVSAEYLEVMRIPVLRGRGFNARDVTTAEPVALISETAARTQFHDDEPIGRHIQVGEIDENRSWAVIVGVIGDVHQYGLDQKPDAAVYIPFSQAGQAQGWSSLVIRSSVPSERIESAVRASMTAVDPLQPIFHVQPMATYISLSVAQRTFTLILIALFGGTALALAAGGVYGVVSYVVEQRTPEMGLRLALGATPGAVSWMILRQMLAIGGVGAGAGIFVWAAFTHTVSTLLFGISRLDARTIAEVLLILLAAALTASCIPVVRAGRVDPAVALRAE